MKYFLPFLILTVAIAACSDSSISNETSEDVPPPVKMDPASVTAFNEPDAIPAGLDADGKVLITVDRLIPEPEACLVMMSVINGTDETVTAGLFAFDVTGNGEQAGANMFPQTAEPATMQTAQIVLPGADCADAQVIEGGQVNCKLAETGESCLDITELRDGVVDFSANDN